MTLMSTAGFVAAVCPTAPGNAELYTNQIVGYILWAVQALFLIGLIIGIASIIVGRIFSMPQASQVGIISIVIVFLSVIAYMILPGTLDGMTGAGCI